MQQTSGLRCRVTGLAKTYVLASGIWSWCHLRRKTSGHTWQRPIEVVVRLSDIPALGINLDKRIGTFGSSPSQWVFCASKRPQPCMDGSREDCDGQYRKVSGSLFRLTWTSDGTRCNGHIKMSSSLQKLANKKLVSRWSLLHRCSQSHIKALQRAVSLFSRRFPASCILEDNVATPAGAERNNSAES